METELKQLHQYSVNVTIQTQIKVTKHALLVTLEILA